MNHMKVGMEVLQANMNQVNGMEAFTPSCFSPCKMRLWRSTIKLMPNRAGRRVSRRKVR